MKKKSCKAAVLVLAGCMLFQLTAGISAYGAELQEEETEVTDSYETDEARQEPPELSETLPDNSENAEDEIDDTPENTGEEESISDLPDSVPETSVPETVQETGNNTPQNEGSSAESVSPEQSDIEPAAEDTVEREDVNQPAGASVSYEAHVQNIGWMNPVKDGARKMKREIPLKVRFSTVLTFRIMAGLAGPKTAGLQEQQERKSGWRQWRLN